MCVSGVLCLYVLGVRYIGVVVVLCRCVLSVHYVSCAFVLWACVMCVLGKCVICISVKFFFNIHDFTFFCVIYYIHNKFYIFMSMSVI
jgi:hypothetical protein